MFISGVTIAQAVIGTAAISGLVFLLFSDLAIHHTLPHLIGQMFSRSEQYLDLGEVSSLLAAAFSIQISILLAFTLYTDCP